MSKIIKSRYHTSERDAKKITIPTTFDNNYAQNHQALAVPDDQVGGLEEKLQNLRGEIERAEETARQIVADAERQAATISEMIQSKLEQAELEIAEHKQRAIEEGYQDGYAQGQADGFSSYSTLIEQAQMIVAQSEQEYEKTIDSSQPVIVELAAALAQRIVGQKLTDDEEMWSAILLQVMTEVREHENVRIYVHPDWYERTNQQKEELEQIVSHTEKLFIYPDAGLMKNGCVIESKYGRIEATVDKQLSELKGQLLEKLKEGDNERGGSY
ncbi:flagellar assembly protein FliH [Alkalihalobacillus sp. MEB130]|uniref:flagellar assembly protein FliH n=1 Tax=Alkalihalobacillus sp. MEB130 TaxID=2976704 RepID=UPI0028DE7877|nr:flagellar assembly protein FliH [Alkalihalobacillus sp. MEB130]MDT8859027.1 flagellar assembly protein FliH [Alkalihalobacillus sp. MEB130]